jgi:hypothetical protein
MCLFLYLHLLLFSLSSECRQDAERIQGALLLLLDQAFCEGQLVLLNLWFDGL